MSSLEAAPVRVLSCALGIARRTIASTIGAIAKRTVEKYCWPPSM